MKAWWRSWSPRPSNQRERRHPHRSGERPNTRKKAPAIDIANTRSIVRSPMRTAVRFPARVSLEQILDGLLRDEGFQETVTRWERIPPKPARYAPFPEWLDGRISAALRRRGSQQLHS